MRIGSGHNDVISSSLHGDLSLNLNLFCVADSLHFLYVFNHRAGVDVGHRPSGSAGDWPCVFRQHHLVQDSRLAGIPLFGGGKHPLNYFQHTLTLISL